MPSLRCLLFGTLLTVLAAPDALAQPTPAPAASSSAMTDKARQLYVEGNQLFREKKWPQAEASFEAAWALEKHYSIAANLAETKLRLGKHRAAAELLVFALGHAPASDTAERRHGEELLAQAKAKIGTLTIHVQPADAAVTVGERSLPAAALSDPVFVEPGQVTVSARKDGYQTTTKTVAAAAGSAAQVDLTLAPIVVAAPSATVAPSATATAAKMPPKPLWPVITGSVAVVAGAAIGIGFTVKASDDRAARLDLLSSLAGTNPCGSGTPYSLECKMVRDLSAAERAETGVAISSFVIGGAALAGVVSYAIWRQGSASDKSADAPKSIAIVPSAGKTGAGLEITGSF